VWSNVCESFVGPLFRIRVFVELKKHLVPLPELVALFKVLNALKKVLTPQPKLEAVFRIFNAPKGALSPMVRLLATAERGVTNAKEHNTDYSLRNFSWN
jgi:hypothetical protein